LIALGAAIALGLWDCDGVVCGREGGRGIVCGRGFWFYRCFLGGFIGGLVYFGSLFLFVFLVLVGMTAVQVLYHTVDCWNWLGLDGGL